MAWRLPRSFSMWAWTTSTEFIIVSSFPGPYGDARTRHGREEHDSHWATLSRVFSVPVLRGTDSHHDDRSTPRSGQQQRKSSASRVKLRNENSGVAWKLTFIVAKCDRLPA